MLVLNSGVAFCLVGEGACLATGDSDGLVGSKLNASASSNIGT